jgi:hypothetical protein
MYSINLKYTIWISIVLKRFDSFSTSFDIDALLTMATEGVELTVDEDSLGGDTGVLKVYKCVKMFFQGVTL